MSGISRGHAFSRNLKEGMRRLKAAFDAIFSDEEIVFRHPEKTNSATRAALYTLYSYAKPKPEHQTGLVFDARLYEETLNVIHGHHVYLST